MMRRRRAKPLPVVARLSLSMAMVAWSVAPACAGDGGSIDGTGKLILRGLDLLGKALGLG
jgi:hypothetical protein